MSGARRLPFTFDPAALKSDLDGIGPREWVPHLNPQYYEGEWSGVALRSTGGHMGQLYADPSKPKSYADTPALAKCRHIREALGAFECPLETVRLLKLASGSRIREHSDLDLGERFGVVRVHVPVLTNPSVEFSLGGESVLMREGEGWYLDLSLPHSVD